MRMSLGGGILMNSMRKVVFSALTLFGIFAPPALSADVIQEPAEGAAWVWSITPRLWYLWENDFYYQDSFDFQQSNEAIDYPFYGGSISLSPGAGETSYSLTVMYGSGNGVYNGLKNDEGIVNTWDGNVDVQRFDTEGIAQIPLGEGLNAVIGGRYINFQRNEKADIFSYEFPDLSVVAKNDLEQDFYLGELGFGLSRPVADDGGLVFFGNITGMFGYADVVKATADPGIFNLRVSDLQGGVVGVDTNAGIGFRASDNLFLSARYRLFYLSAPDFDFDVGGTFMQGPEVNATITFQ